MASSYKFFTVYFTFTNGKHIHIIVVALNLERLYNKTSDLGIDYYYYYKKRLLNIFTDCNKCTWSNVHVITSIIYIAKK